MTGGPNRSSGTSKIRFPAGVVDAAGFPLRPGLEVRVSSGPRGGSVGEVLAWDRRHALQVLLARDDRGGMDIVIVSPAAVEWTGRSLTHPVVRACDVELVDVGDALDD